AHADAVEPALGVTLDGAGCRYVQAVKDGGHDVDGVVVLATDFAAVPKDFGPGDDARVGGSTVELVAFPHLERGVEGHRPPGRVVVVGFRPAQLVDHGEVGLDVVGDPVGELHLIHGAVGAALAAGAVV